MYLFYNIIGFAVIALLILFQPEIRRFFRGLGKNAVRQRSKKNNKKVNHVNDKQYNIQAIKTALLHMSKKRTGALIVFAKNDYPQNFSNSGVIIDGKISSALLESIFNKESPIHDGAVIITHNKIQAASCVLPVSQNKNMPTGTSLRHRAGLGVTEKNNHVFAFIVSEENGTISFAHDGKLRYGINEKEMMELLLKHLVL